MRSDRASAAPPSASDGPPVYLLAPGQRIAYLEVRKVGCTSLKHFVAALSKQEVPEHGRIHRGFPSRFVRRPDRFDRSEWFAFTFVRHPVDRFLSFYRDKVALPDHFIARHLKASGIDFGITISEVLDAVERIDPRLLERHVRPQCELVVIDGRLAVDFIGRLERFDEDWQRLCSLAGQKIAVPHENRGTNVARFRLSEDDYGRLLRFCGPDMALFGYRPPAFADVVARYQLDPGAAGSEPKSRRAPTVAPPEPVRPRGARIEASTQWTKETPEALMLHPNERGAGPATATYEDVALSGHTRLECRVASRNDKCRELKLRLEVCDVGSGALRAFDQIRVGGRFARAWSLDFPPLYGPHDVAISAQLGPKAPDHRFSGIRVRDLQLLAASAEE